MSSVDVHISILTDVLIVCTFMFMPVITWSLFPVLLFQDSQSAMYRSGPGLFKMLILYWSIYSMICCKCWDSVATSLLIIATNGLLSVIMHMSLTKE